MAHRLMTWQKATALVPLALLSGAWTTSLAVTGSASAASDGEGKLPDGTSVPVEAIEAPASVSVPGVVAPGVPAGSADTVVASASTNGIPAAALAAYQRAAQVIDSADPTCNIEWPLIAAIGRVESDHGRYGGNRLDDEGVSTPGIYGIPLDGSNGTARISDTDAGELDNDGVFDRAVGPMQFIPSTWSVVGVDGDGDGVRNPQDIDDAALATAVYLCSGDEDLSTEAGQRGAVYRYNHSDKYVDLVLSIMRAYSTGDYAAVPNASYSSPVFTPSYGDAVMSAGTTGYQPPKASPRSRGGASGGSGSGSPGGSGGSTGGTTTPTTPEAPGGSDPVQETRKTVEGTVKQTEETVRNTVTPLEQATQWCQSNLSATEMTAIGGLSACTDAYLSGGSSAVNNLLGAGGLLG
ncbi:MAG TPA: lytic murein transglycosylase [Nocardioides sp.]|nr:lytic murein transglycosylase [Nocardioides sp.]